jgi:hypothetical protein
VPRQNRRRNDVPRASGFGALQRVEQWRGEDFTVRTVTGATAVKAYRCPGCDHLVPIGVPHVVVWPTDDLDAGDRRHWHTACWAAREHRMPNRRR